MHKINIIDSARHEKGQTVKKLNSALLKIPGNGRSGYTALFIYTCLVFCILITQISLLTGCGNQGSQSSPEHQSSEGNGRLENIPDNLKEIEDDIEKIIGVLDGPTATPFEGEVMMKSRDSENVGTGAVAKNPGQQEAQDISKNGGSTRGEGNIGTNTDQGKQDNQGNQDKQDSQVNQNKPNNQAKQDDRSKGSETGGGSNQNGQQQQQQQQKMYGDNTQGADPWEEITVVINKMHYTWNSYLPEALKIGTSQKTIDDFGNALNSLTNEIITKNKSNTLMSANSLYSHIPDLFAKYKTGAPPEIKRLRYYARNAVLSSLTANWSRAEADVASLVSTWAILKNIISEEQQDTKNKLDYSILELEKVVKEKNQPLTDIKGRITLSNIMELEESFPS